ncbi:tyrosine-protein phosphatase [Leuconostoc gasicomitatum]|uniref:Tyrosine-protein phosphatase n=1 Tax=Leuconostoc gasicomitatum TaxID=115778 RepID=A0ABM9V1U6_9LACO|nr:CpsB/CapC family capsule biosynthesis tyrosine phosphatase [Leuconostoc gasicomitatum]MBR2276374.1 tyrosine protein phosphatase [Leuconostoc sp.]MBZ5954370.1 tyrosine protein phosphatase [Leuconostoc gasicomitatum]MBZ5970011.1 tyrosine protein phosphatase [Leuconostoc gasicomitatum]MBZ5973529.1 tyrosine protein phosphatase [Leuconostoc gasicomitatum]MBZ5997636.1 tyrosine protein phosphatase [Leuconostoc gasicomitatum]
MIDLHSHLLPNIDDGSKSLRASLRMANEAVENGIEAALMTPHHMNGHYVNHKADVIQLTSQFQEHLDKENIPLQVFPSQEVRINGGLIEALDNDDILFADDSNRYLLLEFPDDDVPTYSEDMIFKIMQRGISIQIAHPERNTKIMADPDILYSLIEKGAIAQVTASSYVGSFGKKVQKFAESIIAHNLAHVFVSDAHDLPNRDYEMREALNKLNSVMGKAYQQQFEKNAEAIIDGNNVEKLIPEPIVKRRFFNGF